jgi:DNA-cytosine methyltransferase
MNVLSLFDGMSCGQIALNKLGVKVNKYFACEIDKYAMQVTQHNFPDTIQLGDVQFVTKETFGTHKIDLVIGGSPCQGFSFAGKQLNFEDPRSALFFEFVRLVKDLKPRYFLLENVKMKKESQDIISKYMGVEPIEINSSLVSAQTRKRLYWTNIPNVSQPEDKGVVLRDIIEKGDSCDVELNENQQNKIEKINNVNPDKANCLTEAIGRGGSSAEYLTSVKKKTDAVEQADDKPIKIGNIYPSGGQNGNVYSEDGKSPSILAGTGNKGTGVGSCNAPKIEQVDDKLRHPEATKKGYAEAGEDEGLDLTFPKSKTRRGRAMKDKSNCLTAASQEMGIVESFEVSEKRKKIIEKNLGDRINDETEIIGSSQKNAYVGKDKSSSLTSAMGEGGGHVPMLKIDPSKPNQINPDAYNDKKLSWRKLTPLECERLQTVPDGYSLVLDDNGKQLVSDSQRYKMLGNGWTIDVITHIMKNMEL